MNKTSVVIISMFCVAILGQRFVGLKSARASFEADICFMCELDKGLDEMRKSIYVLEANGLISTTSKTTQSIIGGLVDPVVVNIDSRANSRTL